MRKAKILQPEENWGSLNTKYPPSSKLVGTDQFTSGSKNWRTDEKGVITKRLGTTPFQSFTGTPKDQYESIFSDGVHHLLEVASGTLKYSSGTTFSDVTAGYSAGANFEFAQYLDRVYFGNGVDADQVYDRSTTYGGVVYTAPKTKAMGAQAPVTAPTTVDGGAGLIAAGTYTYKVTFLYYDFEESNGGPASTPLVLGANRQVSLTAIPVGGYGVTARKIYREIASAPGLWRLVQTISNNTATTATDNQATSTSLIPDDNNVPPKFKYVVQWQDRLFIGGLEGAPFEIDYSGAGFPDVFPFDNFVTANSQDYVTGLVVYNDRVIVFNRNSFGQILGNSPDTYRYSQVPGAIGCSDNRTIAIRTINGVPILIWLSDRGFYGFNGSSVQYLSDFIEPDVNLNIQQAAQVTGQNVQTSQSDFTAGTASVSVSTTLSPGDVTQANPTKTWTGTASWEEAASAQVSVASKNVSGVLTSPTRMAQVYATDGTLTGVTSNVGNLEFPVYSPTSLSDVMAGTFNFIGDGSSSLISSFATPFQFANAGIITSYNTGQFIVSTVDAAPRDLVDVLFSIYRDVGGVPDISGGSLYFKYRTNVSSGSTVSDTSFPNLQIAANTKYWFVIALLPVNSVGGFSRPFLNDTESSLTPTVLGPAKVSLFQQPFGPYNDAKLVINPSQAVYGLKHTINLTTAQNPVVGQWTSATLDTFSTSTSPTTISHTGSFPATFGAVNASTTFVEGSTDGVSFDVSQSYNSLNGSSAVSLANRRYWRLRIMLSTSDNRTTPSIGPAILLFPLVGTFVSAPIDHTTDITALNSLTMDSVAPAGTSAVVEIATSADNMTYSAFSAVGLATPQRYSKVRVTLTTPAGNDATAVVNSVILNWTIIGTFQSSAIDTISTPAGWDIFSTTFTNGVTYEIRSGASLIALAAASYVAVTNGAFPAIPANRFVQWRATLSSTANTVALLASVTVKWFVSTISSLRAASIFFDKTYFCAVAEFGQTTNNIIFVFDFDGNWQIYRGVSVATLSFFFNEPYFADGAGGFVRRFLEGMTDSGTNIELDIRTKAFDLDTADKRKVIQKVFIVGRGTGCTITPSYSTDGGQTFKVLVNSAGASSFTTTNNSQVFVERLTPRSADDYQGQSFLIRLLSNDSNDVEIHEIRSSYLIREGDIL